MSACTTCGADPCRNPSFCATGHDADREALGGPAAWRRGAFTAAQLQKEKFPPILWIVPNIIPAEGVALLCAKPKFGKSLLALDLSIACTTDRLTLGTIEPSQGEVLYLALEDSKRRLQRRMTKLLPTFGVTWPEALTLKTEWRRLHEGGLDDIRDWHAHTKAKGGKPILVVIDVLAKVRRPVGNRQLYESDYAALADLNKLATELGLAIVVVHHTRKMPADDLMETVSGSYGIAGAVDTILVMGTKTSGTVLDIRGRDVESAQLAIQFDKKTCLWHVLGNAVEVQVSEQRAKIIHALREAGEPRQILALAEATDMKRNPLEVLLGRMAKDGEIQRVEKGLYAHNDYIPPPSHDSPSKEKLGRKRRLSVAPVRLSKGPIDAETEVSAMQAPETTRQNTGICPSVPSVRENADTNGASTSVPAQTDRTDGQIAAEPIDNSQKYHVQDLSGHLSREDRQIDGRQFPATVEKPDDGLAIPESLRRTGRRCDHCGGQHGILNPWDWRGRPGGIWLHPRCEGAWQASETHR